VIYLANAKYFKDFQADYFRIVYDNPNFGLALDTQPGKTRIFYPDSLLKPQKYLVLLPTYPYLWLRLRYSRSAKIK